MENNNNRVIAVLVVVAVLVLLYYYFSTENFDTSPGTYVQLASSSSQYPWYGRRVWYNPLSYFYPYGYNYYSYPYLNNRFYSYPWRRRVYVNQYPRYRRW